MKSVQSQLLTLIIELRQAIQKGLNQRIREGAAQGLAAAKKEETDKAIVRQLAQKDLQWPKINRK